jgi:thioesterase domain-containing protein
MKWQNNWALFSDSLKDKAHFKNIMRERLAFLEKEIGETSIGFDDFLNSIWRRMELLCNYHPKQINTKVVLYKALDLQTEYQEIDDPFNHWESYVNQIDLELIPGDHDSMLKFPNVNILVEKLIRYIQ